MTLTVKQQNALSGFNQFIGNSAFIACLAGFAGSGKQQPLSAPILTPSGWQTMGDIKIGSMVTGSNGQFIRVLAIYPQGVKDTYRVTFSDGVFVHCGLDHLWAVQTKKLRQTGKKVQIKNTEQLLQDYLTGIPSIPYKYSVQALSAPVAGNTTVKDAYAIGYILGNGTMSRSNELRLCVHSDDSQEIKGLNQFSLGEPRNEYGVKGTNSYNLVYNLNKCPKELYPQIGLHSLERYLPENWLQWDAQSRKQLLKGLMDSDGTVGKKRCDFSTKSQQLALGVRDLVRSLGGASPENCHQQLRGRVKDDTPEYTVPVRTPFNCFELARKSERWELLVKSYDFNESIIDIRKDGVEAAQCITVDSLDHLYVTSGFKLTHNTYTLLECLKAQPSLEIALLASTNTAVNNVKKATDGIASVYGTVHSFLGLTPSTEEWTEYDEAELSKLHALNGNISATETRKLRRLEIQKKKYLSGEMSFGQSDKEAARVGLVIIDEAFMLNKEVVELCAQYAYQNQIKIVFVGDPFQLPPVNEKKSYIFELAIKPENTWFLDEVVRYDGNILMYATALRESVKLPAHQANRVQMDYHPYVDDVTVFSMNWKELKTQIPDLYNEPDKTTAFIAYTNKTVDEFNERIREILQKPKDSYVVGDQLVAHKKCGRTTDGDINHYYGETYIRTSQYMTVTAVVSTTKKNGYTAQWVRVMDDIQCSRLIFLPVPTELGRWKNDEKSAADKIKVFNSSNKAARGQAGESAKQVWKELGLKNWSTRLDGSNVSSIEYTQFIKDYKRSWAQLTNLFDPIQLAYCITCHKSQGRTIDYVILARELFEQRTKNILQESYVNLLYTGLTRTKEQLVIME
jgi:UvrD-like helicase C-terminal domain/AAA domain